MKLFLYSFVGGFETEELLSQLKDPPTDEILDLHINSPGGSVMDGFAIYSRLKNLPNTVNTYIDGLAGSVAAVVAMAGDNIYISEAGSIMIHSASSMMGGNAQDLEKQIDQLKAIDKVQIGIFQKRTGLSQSKIKEMLEAETILMAKDALKFGFADQITKPIKAVALLNLNDMNIKEKIKGLASIVFGENLETDELKDLQKDLEAKSQTEIDGKVQDKDGKDALFSEYVPTAEFIKFKNQMTEFVGNVVTYITDQPTSDEILNSIKENTNDELFKLLTDIKSKNKVPTAKEHEQIVMKSSGGFDLDAAKKMHFKNKNN